MKQRTNRRRFLKVCAAGAVPLAAASAVAAQEQPAAAPETPAAALAALARLRFGKHLTDAQLKVVQQEITTALRLAESLKREALEPGEEPALVFLADVPE